MSTPDNEPEAAGPSCYYLILSAVIGAVVLGLEVLAARTMAPSIGTGAMAWAALLAVALGTLAVGNLIGGAMAGRSSADSVVTWSFATAAAAMTVLSRIYRPLMTWAAGLPLVGGSLVAATLTQFIPMLVLGTNTPVLLQAGESRARKGIWHGLVLACGSAGGIAGALIVALVFLPSFGLGRSYLLLSLVLILATTPAMCRRRCWTRSLVLLALLAAIAVCWWHSEESQIVQSQYGEIETRHEAGQSILLIDGLPQTGLSGYADKWEALKQGYLLEVLFLLPTKPRNALVIGLGAGLAPGILGMHGIDCESVEIDPRVVEVARNHFGFTGKVTVADGRSFLRRPEKKWDLIVLDVCTSERLPVHMFTVETMRLAKKHLSNEGILALQFIGDNGRWSASVVHTVSRVFRNPVACRASASMQPVGPCWVFAGRGTLALLPDAMDTDDFGRFCRRVEITVRGELLTDDHFPAELDWARTAALWRQGYSLF